MLGVGGGFVIVPAVRQFTDIEMLMAAATLPAVVALASSFTAVSTFSTGVDLTAIGWSFVAAAVARLAAGRLLAERIPSR
jgi:uncharacterized membrane protein YfcA